MKPQINPKQPPTNPQTNPKQTLKSWWHDKPPGGTPGLGYIYIVHISTIPTFCLLDLMPTYKPTLFPAMNTKITRPPKTFAAGWRADAHDQQPSVAGEKVKPNRVQNPLYLISFWISSPDFGRNWRLPISLHLTVPQPFPWCTRSAPACTVFIALEAT